MTPDIRRILVPLDFSTNSRRALDYAHGLARALDAALHLVHVCEVPGTMTAALDAYAVADNEWSESLSEEVRTALCPVLTVREPKEKELAGALDAAESIRG